MKRFLTVSTMMLAIVILAACGQATTARTEGSQPPRVDEGTYRSITSAQLAAMLENKDFLLVNVHVPYDGEIPMTDLFIPYNEIEPNLSKLPGDKGAKLVVYCASGSMSAIAAGKLVGLGFTNVWNLDSGMLGWEKQGYARIRKPQ